MKRSFADFDLNIETKIFSLSPESDEWLRYEKEELSKPQGRRWLPDGSRRLARSLYGSEAGKTAFVIGCGPSIDKAKRYLSDEKHEGCFRIAVNRAIKEIPAEYCAFIDYPAYKDIREDGNFKRCIKLGVDRFGKLYDSDVYVFERAYTLEDLRGGKILHRSCTLLSAIHLATWLGASRVVTVGCENIPKPGDEINAYTYRRIKMSLCIDTPYWLPSWCQLLDASHGDLPLPQTYINRELELARRIHVDGTKCTENTIKDPS